MQPTALLPLMVLLAADPKPGSEGTPGYEQAAALVRQLGHPRFALREAAAKELVELGAAAVPALVAGSKSQDQEVRTRCEALLPQAKAAEWRRRAAAYLAKPDDKYDLPLLAEWDKLIAKPDAGSRKLFAEMIRANGELLERAAADRKGGQAALTVRCREVLQGVRGDQKQLAVSVGDLAALFFVHRQVAAGPADWGDRDHPADLLGNPGLLEGIKAKDVGRAFRKLLVAWADARPVDDVRCEQFFGMAVMNNPFPEAVPVLSKWARSDKESRLNVRAVAFDALGKIGTPEATATLTELIDDKTLITRGAGYDVCLGDHALAVLVTSAGKKLDDYGVNSGLTVAFRSPGGTHTMFTLHSFPDEDARKKGVEKWKAEATKNQTDK